MTDSHSKGRFFSESDGEILNLSNRHACEPKIVSELLFPVSIANTFIGNILIHLAKKSTYYIS